MQVQALETDIFTQGESLLEFVIAQVGAQLKEKDILLVTSKIVSLSEGRVLKNTGQDKQQLVVEEADQFLGALGHNCFLTIKAGLLIPSAGIDESNSETGDYILFPKDPYQSAYTLWSGLRERLGLSHLGVIITDSHTTALRRGVIGVALSHWGFQGLKSQVGERDLFGRELKMTQQNQVDALAVSGVLLMGEGAECRPLARVRGAPVEFCQTDVRDEVTMSYEEDLYFPLYGHLLSEKK